VRCYSTATLPVTNPAADHAAVLPHVASSPDLGVLLRLRHDPIPTAGVAPAHRPGRQPDGKGGTGPLPTFTDVRSDRCRRPAIPRRHRLGPHIAVLAQGLPPPKSHRRWERTSQTHGPPSTAKRSIHQIQQTADDSRGFRHRFSFLTPFPSPLAGTSRPVVPARPYIVETASSLTPNPGLSLPPASTSHCDDRRRALPPARLPSAPRGARDFSSTHKTIAFSGGAMYKPTTSRTLSMKNGSADNLNVSTR
jgi:hypothetical protein